MSHHLKRIAAPASWPILRRTTTYAAKPSPGPHRMAYALPLSMVLKHLGHARTTFEVRKILQNTPVLVDGRRIKDANFPMGVMDTLGLANGEHCRIILNTKGKLALITVKKEEALLKPCRIIGKRTLRGGKIQLNLSGGRSIRTDKSAHKPGDTLLLALPKQDIKEHLALQKDNYVFLTAGKYAGLHGTVKDISEGKILVATQAGECRTAQEYALVIGKDKPLITLP